MRKEVALAVILGSVAVVSDVGAQSKPDLSLNLAAGTPQTVDVDTGEYRLVLGSALPLVTYEVAIGPATAVIPPPSATQPFTLGASPCSALTTFQSTALLQKTEEDLQALITKSAPIIRLCDTEARETFAQEIRRPHPQTFTMSAGTTRTVVVRRLTAGTTLAERSWTITLKAPERGRWLTTYGVGFSPDRGDEFFLDAAGDNRFRVAPQRRDRDALNYIPAVFFTWIPRAQQLNDLTHGPTAGLGFEAKVPTVFAGYQWSWNYNIGVMAGVAVHPHKRLRGRYSENDIVTETLTDAQLHDQVYAPNIVLAFTFRLGSNPFAARRPRHPPSRFRASARQAVARGT